MTSDTNDSNNSSHDNDSFTKSDISDSDTDSDNESFVNQQSTKSNNDFFVNQQSTKLNDLSVADWIRLLITLSCYINLIIYDIFHDPPNMINDIIEHPISSSFHIGMSGCFYSMMALLIADFFPPILVFTLLNISTVMILINYF